MAKHLLTFGIGLNPGSMRFLVLQGLGVQGPVPVMEEALAPASTLSISHARILRGYRDAKVAKLFHNLIREKTS